MAFSGRPESTKNPSGSTIVLLIALFLSGIAAIINQTVWQRALKVFLAGSEAISSLIVVLVFMFGLGIGALFIGRFADRIRNPLRLLAVVEILLLLINFAICYTLSLDISESANAFQKAAVSIGLPLRLLYALVSALLLLVPCFLMGVTMPLASEGAQRQIRITDSRFLTILFCLNTLGAVAGGLASGYYLMPYLGQQLALVYAALLNGAAGIVLLALYLIRYRGTAITLNPSDSQNKTPLNFFSPYTLLAFALGFMALAYEMYLFRAATLAFNSLPYTFSAALCIYLFMWSAGVFIARWLKLSLLTALIATALSVIVITLLYNNDFWYGGLIGFCVLYSVPCIFFGILFGLLVSQVSVEWGKDVGRIYGMNTFGSCLGIVFTVLIGYEWSPIILSFAISAAYAAVAALWYWSQKTKSVDLGSRKGNIVLTALTLIFMISLPISELMSFPSRKVVLYSREGVVEVHGRKQMLWDGLWHSDLSQNNDHVGTKNWFLATAPLMCRPQRADQKTLVVGMGTGITVASLARSANVQSVDVYEINHQLADILEMFPDGTLNVGTDPKVNIKWQDGRTGMVLNEKKYDLITQQPLYLKQAGSSILLSREYMELVKSRLTPGGIFCIYCNSLNNEGQALVVRKTASAVFQHCESFLSGYMILASDSPLEITEEEIQKYIDSVGSADVIAREIVQYGVTPFAKHFDRPRLDWEGSPVMVTDNHPIVEYPAVANQMVRKYQQQNLSNQSR